ncbi:phage portal protein [Krasilnikovia sp. MM14-A1259]|uniref:phage portal protein n=1 Tax=Krasilnikovia sp. MM14-A1259 TaxID=3373539 RepID=UPI003812F25C
MGLISALRSAFRPRGDVARYTLSDYLQWSAEFGAMQDPMGYRTTYGNMPAEPIGESFVQYVNNAYRSNGIVYACEMVRVKVFAEARFQFQALRGGRPAELFGNPSLSILERPFAGGTTGDMLSRMILDADFAGNWFGTIVDDELVRLRPDWVDIVLAPRYGPGGGQVGFRKVGFIYYEGGKQGQGALYGQEPSSPVVFLADEVAHFAPSPDPLAEYRGMSWLTPVVREIQSDGAATRHKLKWFENAATPNLAVSLAKEITPEQFELFVEKMDSQHKGPETAGKTLYTAGGADVTVIGADMKQMDFKTVQGAGESRIAAAAGIHPVVAALSEGMQGSSLNAGNFQAAKRAVGQITFRPLWRNAAGSLEVLVPSPDPATSRLWYDSRDVDFLREDERDAADIRNKDAQTARTLLDAGWEPDAAAAFLQSGDARDLIGRHTGLYSVQLQPPGTAAPVAVPAARAQQLLDAGWRLALTDKAGG